MDIRYLVSEKESGSVLIETYTSMADRRKRREAFYRSLLRSASVCLLFAAIGCFYVIYVTEKGGSFGFFAYDAARAMKARDMLKELFVLSFLPCVGFALCFPLRGLPGRLCDTLFPAAYGLLSGGIVYRELTGLSADSSVGAVFRSAPFLLFVVFADLVYTLICAVFASYARCRFSGSATHEDGENCFSYALLSVTALAVLIILRVAAVLLLNLFV